MPLSVLAVFIAMVLSFLSVSFRPYMGNWRYFGVKLFITILDTIGLHEQNRVMVIDITVLFLLDNGFSFKEIKGEN